MYILNVERFSRFAHASYQEWTGKVAAYWFRRGHATVQHHKRIADEQIQGQRST